MSLLDDILQWSQDRLARWQQDCLRRLFQKQTLDPDDHDDLYAMLKSSHGLPDKKNRQPVPLAQTHLPTQTTAASPLVLVALRDLKSVNRIAAGQNLPFAPKGITIVYGHNASGKSGYARVLKRACRARDDRETVHPDASDPKAAREIPEAVFDVDSEGQVTSLSWSRDSSPPEELSTIAVFDSRCARAYLDTEQDVAYVPYGLDIVESLAQQVMPTLSRRLDNEIATVDTATTGLADLVGDTAVGQLVEGLSSTTDPEQVKVLATLSTEEQNRLVSLRKVLAEADPKAKARSLRLTAQRIDALRERIDAVVLRVDNDAVEKLKALDIEAESASQAEIAAAAQFRTAEPLLPGTGEKVWKTLFEAARQFSTEVAYENQPFPNVDDGAVCLLCQRPLDQAAQSRLQRFEAFVREETAKTAVKKRTQRERATLEFKNASVDFGLDAATTVELAQLSAEVSAAITAYQSQVDTRKQAMLKAVETHDWSDAPLLSNDPRPDLKTLANTLVDQAANLENAADEEKKKLLEAERAELDARESLSKRQQAVLDLIQRMRIKVKLDKCKEDLKTKPVSDKAKALSNKAVTQSLQNALNVEFQLLGARHVKAKLKSRVEHGKTKHKLVLDLPGTTKIDEILSEGEQRIIALGSFLAELHLAGHHGGIVFDDPVSSLDHRWRRNVAYRLVREAKRRQVIVFTHDTAFLGEMRDAIEQKSVPHLIHSLEWAGGSPGQVRDGLPWEHKSYKDRLDKLTKAQKALERAWPAYPTEADRAKMRRVYGDLRATIERVIQDVVFNGVVQRYRDWIRVDKLNDVVGFAEPECKEICRLHKKCCGVVAAHDPASAKNAPVPDPPELFKDIDDLVAVTDAIKSRQRRS